MMNFILWRYIGDAKRKLSAGLTSPVAKYFSYRAISIPIIFATMAIIYLVNPKVAVFIPMFIPLIMWAVFAPLRKKMLKAQPKP
jgi:Flp pilus assembly protein TadB